MFVVQLGLYAAQGRWPTEWLQCEWPFILTILEWSIYLTA